MTSRRRVYRLNSSTTCVNGVASNNHQTIRPRDRGGDVGRAPVPEPVQARSVACSPAPRKQNLWARRGVDACRARSAASDCGSRHLAPMTGYHLDPTSPARSPSCLSCDDTRRTAYRRRAPGYRRCEADEWARLVFRDLEQRLTFQQLHETLVARHVDADTRTRLRSMVEPSASVMERCSPMSVEYLSPRSCGQPIVPTATANAQ